MNAKPNVGVRDNIKKLIHENFVCYVILVKSHILFVYKIDDFNSIAFNFGLKMLLILIYN